jgi:hypothetical protein
MIPNVMMLLIEKLAADGRISQAEALDVRRAIFPDGAVSRGEAEALFALNERVGGDDPAWNSCFVEAIFDHLTLAEEPKGHVTEEGAAWLENRIHRDAVIELSTELELVMKLCEKAESCPTRIHEMARKLVKRAVLEGKGYEGRDPKLVPGQIGETELSLIRRVLFAAAGAGNVAVMRDEAEWLFEIDEATEGRAHVAGWRDLFVSAVMNHLFAVGPSSLLNRDAMMKRAAWLNKPTSSGGVGGFIARVMEGGVKGFKEKATQANPIAAQFAHVDRRHVEAHVAEALDTAEAAWLVTRIRADRRRTANEQALVDAVNAAKGGALKSA